MGELRRVASINAFAVYWYGKPFDRYGVCYGANENFLFFVENDEVDLNSGRFEKFSTTPLHFDYTLVATEPDAINDIPYKIVEAASALNIPWSISCVKIKSRKWRYTVSFMNEEDAIMFRLKFG